MAKAPVSDAERRTNADFVRVHLDTQLALITALIATTQAAGSSVDHLRAREARLRAFIERFQGNP